MNTQPNDHIVKSYDEEQRRIVAEIVRMGETAVAQLRAQAPAAWPQAPQ